MQPNSEFIKNLSQNIYYSQEQYRENDSFPLKWELPVAHKS